jgi:hypothetical protein
VLIGVAAVLVGAVVIMVIVTVVEGTPGAVADAVRRRRRRTPVSAADPYAHLVSATKTARAALRRGASGNWTCANPECFEFGVPSEKTLCPACGDQAVSI